MVSSYGKHTWFHQTIGVLSFLLMCLSYALLHSKQTACTTPLLPRDEMANWVENQRSGTELSADNLRAHNHTELADEMVHYVMHYYDAVAYFHWVILIWCGAIMILSWINIVPKHEDMKVLTILLTILVMGLMAMFALYTAFLAFHKPCKESPANSSGYSVFIKLYHWLAEQTSNLIASINQAHSNSTTIQQQQWSIRNVTPHYAIHPTLSSSGHHQLLKDEMPAKHFKLEFRAIKDKRPVNVYEDEDDTMVHITLIDAGVGFILLCSNFLFFFDSRQHMIEWRN